MSPDGIVEAVDIASDFGGRFSPAPEDSAPDEFGLQRLEERLDHGVVEAVSLSRHRDHNAVLPQLGLIIEGAVLAASVRVVNEADGRAPHGDGPAQSRQCQFFVEPIASCPADDAPGEQVDDDRQIEPALAGPDVGDVGAPLLV